MIQLPIKVYPHKSHQISDRHDTDPYEVERRRNLVWQENRRMCFATAMLFTFYLLLFTTGILFLNQYVLNGNHQVANQVSDNLNQNLYQPNVNLPFKVDEQPILPTIIDPSADEHLLQEYLVENQRKSIDLSALFDQTRDWISQMWARLSNQVNIEAALQPSQPTKHHIDMIFEILEPRNQERYNFK